MAASEEESGQGGAGLDHPRVARREDLEQVDQMLARLVPFRARRAPHDAEQPVVRLFDPARSQFDVGHPGLGLDVIGVLGRILAGLGLIKRADPPDQGDLG